MNRLVLTRIAPWPAARLLGAFYLVLGILLMPCMVLYAVFGHPDEEAATRGAAIGFALFLPFQCYARAFQKGFIAGGLGGLLYNLLARFLGGIPIVLEPEPNPVAANPGPAGA